MKSVYLTWAILLISGSALSQSSNSGNKSSDFMKTTKQNKEVVRQLYEDALNNRNIDLLDQFIAKDYTGPIGLKGAEGFKVPVEALIQASSDIQWELRELIGEGNKVVVKWETKGTHTGPFLHIPATGKKFSNEGMAVYEFQEGRIINVQVLTDRLGFLQDLGELPLDLTTRSGGQPEKDQVIFIDRFSVPGQARDEFVKQMNVNRNLIRELPGFVEDAAYERMDKQGDWSVVTVAIWKNAEALESAKEAVQAAYKKENFNPEEFMKQLDITMDRGTYEMIR